MGFLSRLRAAIFPDRHEAALHDEFDHHLAMRIAQFEAAGMTPEEAQREAERRFGNRTVQREYARDAGRLLWIDHLRQDIRYSFRIMRKTPLITAVAILSLALGIGANTAIFTVLDSLLLKSLPVKNPEQVMFLSWSAKKFPDELLSFHGRGKQTADGGISSTALSYPFFEQLSQRTRVISGAAGFVELIQLPVVADGRVLSTGGKAVSGGYYASLGVAPVIGRSIDESDDRPEAPPVAMISNQFWQSRFGGDAGVLGKHIAIHNVPCAIIGVEPSSFLGLTAGSAPEVTVPLHRLLDFGKQWTATSFFSARDEWWLRIAVRLNPGVTEDRARTELSALFRQDLPPGDGLPVLELHHGAEGADDLRDRFQEPLLILMAVVGVVLLIACANVGNLLLARAHARQKETAMRMALGAGRGRLIRQYLTESVLLSGIGGALGLALAYWASGALVAALPSFTDRLVFDLRPDAPILAFTTGISLLTGLLYGLVPALQATRTNLQPSIQGSHRFRRAGIAQILVVSQLAASVVVLAGAGLYVRTLRNLRNLDTGMNTHNVLAFRVEPGSAAGYTNTRAADFYHRLLERLSAIPGVRAVTMAETIPLSGEFHRVPVEVAGVPEPQNFEDRVAGMNLVGPGFFETMRIPIRLGRAIDDTDREGAPRVAVINETLARTFFPNQSPIGRRFRVPSGPPGSVAFDYQVIGVAANTKFHSLRRAFGPGFFAPWTQSTFFPDRMTFELRTAGDPTTIAAAVRQTVNQVDAAIPVMNLLTIDDQVDAQLKQERLFARISTAFGVLALILASVGLYGVRSFSVSRRTPEIGIRMALGATRGEILALVMRETASLTIAGVVIGLAAGLALTGLIRSMLFGLAPTDPATFAGAALTLAAVAVVAGYLPARRASRVEPMVALRYE
jgi:predicted permease